MKIIGLTGGSGTGKSTVSTLLQAHGAGAVDADAVYHSLCKTCRPMLCALADAFGSGVLDAQGELWRPALAKIVFADPAKLSQLGGITTPYIREASLAALHAQSGRPFVLYDAPTLFETGTDALCADVIGVLADAETRVRRIMARDGLTLASARARIAAQPADAFYRERCRYLLTNNGDMTALSAAADALYQTITEGERS